MRGDHHKQANYDAMIELMLCKLDGDQHLKTCIIMLNINYMPYLHLLRGEEG